MQQHINTTYCKNCGKQVTDSYCAHCGQKAKIERVSFSYLQHEVVHFFTHMEKGFLFTSWNMIARPGITVKNYVEGKRKMYQTPISYFFIWTGIYILLLYWVEKMFGQNVVINYKDYFGPAGTTRYAISHLSLVLAIILPFQALYLLILVTRGAYNYFESLVCALYNLGTIILGQAVFVVIALLIHVVSAKSVGLEYSDPIKVIYLAWFIIDFVKLFPLRMKWARALSFIALAFGTFTLWRIYGFPLVANLFL